MDFSLLSEGRPGGGTVGIASSPLKGPNPRRVRTLYPWLGVERDALALG